ncbi:MAG: hypothetical protein ABIQ53_06625 [Terracoccus sp.]
MNACTLVAINNLAGIVEPSGLGNNPDLIDVDGHPHVMTEKEAWWRCAAASGAVAQAGAELLNVDPGILCAAVELDVDPTTTASARA